MIRTRVIKKCSLNLTAKLAVTELNVFILDILSTVDFKTPCQPPSATRAPLALFHATYTSIQRF